MSCGLEWFVGREILAWSFVGGTVFVKASRFLFYDLWKRTGLQPVPWSTLLSAVKIHVESIYIYIYYTCAFFCHQRLSRKSRKRPRPASPPLSACIAAPTKKYTHTLFMSRFRWTRAARRRCISEVSMSATLPRRRGGDRRGRWQTVRPSPRFGSVRL